MSDRPPPEIPPPPPAGPDRPVDAEAARHARRDRAAATAAAMGAVLCFGAVPVFLRDFTRFLDAWTVNACRYSVAAVFWLPFVLFLVRRPPTARHTRARRTIWLAALVPTIPNLAAQIGFAACPYFLKAPTMSFMLRTSFLFAAVVGFVVIPAERALIRRPLFGLGALLSLVGILLLYLEKLGSTDGGPSLVGLLLALGTAMGYACYAVAVRKFLWGFPLPLAFGVMSLYTTAVLIVLAAAVGDVGQLAHLPAGRWPLLVVSAFLGITFGHVFYHRAIHGMGPVVANGMLMAMPFWTYALAVAFLGERLTALQLIGGVVVVAGGLALVRAKAQLARSTAPSPKTGPEDLSTD